MIDHYYAVIMAGGGGTRLWPLSRLSKPKQLLSFNNDRSLYQISIDRIRETFNPDNVFVVASESMSKLLQQQSPEIPEENFLVEPSPRGTAAAIGLAAAAIKQLDSAPDATMAVLTADHLIQNIPYFNQLLEGCYIAAGTDNLITIGIEPTYAATGYGYIQSGREVMSIGALRLLDVTKFKEKPALDQAEQMIADGNYVWNSGMFVWRIENILKAINNFMPALSTVMEKVQMQIGAISVNSEFSMMWNALEKQTLDYGIMEKAKNVAVIPAKNLGWSDVGSWDSLFDVLPADADGNIVLSGDSISLNSSNTLIYSENRSKVIATIDIKDLVIIDTGDALLICPRQSAQHVRKITEKLKETDRKGYL